MASKPKTGETPKDTQIQPIVQINQPEQDKAENALQDSKLYQEETKSLLDQNNPKEQSEADQPEITKVID